MSLAIKRAALVAVRSLSTSGSRSAASAKGGVVPSNSSYKNLQRLQTEWLADESHFVWQKRGFRDSSLYYATLALCVGGTGYTLYEIFVMSFPQKKD